MKYSETNKPLQCMMTQSTCYNGTTKMDIKGVLWHSTGANNPWLRRYVQPDDNAPNRDELLAIIGTNKYHNDWNHAYKNAGLNCWIGKLNDGSVSTVQTMPWDFKPWGCGAGSKGSCNNGWIQFEISEDSLTDKDYFEAVYKEACEITAYLCKLYNIDPNGFVDVDGTAIPTILCHQDSYRLGYGSNHSDIYHWFPKYGRDMSTVRSDVAALINGDDNSNTDDGDVVPSVPSVPSDNADVTVFKEGDIVKIIGTTYYSGKPIPGWVLEKNWIVYSAPAGSDRIVVNESEDGKSAIKSPFKASDLELIRRPGETEPTPAPAPEPTKPLYEGTPSTGSEDDQKFIWDYFMNMLNNEFGAAGVMGNLHVESAFRSNNLQNSYETKLEYTDSTYTDAVDNGDYTNFINDHAGYGLAQWTYYTRKQALIDYMHNKGKSVGDFKTQLDFLNKELSEKYPPLVAILSNATSVFEAASAFMLQFERPADQSIENQNKRASYANIYYEKYAKPVIEPAEPVVEPAEPVVEPAEPVVANPQPVAEPAKPEVPNTSTDIIYTVQRGDTLSKIAANFKTTYQAIAKYNGIVNPNVIRVGQKIRIPAKGNDLIEVGDVVKIIGKRYYSGSTIPDWVLAKEWIVYSAPQGSNRIVINRSTDGRSSIMSPVRRSDLQLVSKGT